MRYFPPKFGSRNYMILLLKTFSEPSYYRCKSYILLLIAKRHLVILYTRYANSVLASLEPRRSTRKNSLQFIDVNIKKCTNFGAKIQKNFAFQMRDFHYFGAKIQTLLMTCQYSIFLEDYFRRENSN